MNKKSSGLIRGAKIAGSMNALKRKANEAKLDELVPMNETKDPFEMDGENDRDIDYVPSPKKVNSTQKHNPKLLVRRKPLTPQERIARLNKKMSKKSDKKRTANTLPQNIVENGERVSLNLHGDSSIEVSDKLSYSSNNNHDRYFETENDSADVLLTPACSQQEMETMSNDIFNEENENSVVEVLPESANMQSKVARDSRSIFSENDMYLSLSEKIDAMRAELQSIRKQVTRMEARSVMNGECRRSANSLDEIVDDLSSFESKLSEEGLPIGNVDGVIAFETKLKQSSFDSMPYRQKLVRT